MLYNRSSRKLINTSTQLAVWRASPLKQNKMPAPTAQWELIVAETRKSRDAGFAKVEPPLQGIPDDLPLNSTALPKTVLSAQELDITENYTITKLLAALRNRDVSVEEVTRAFLRRAALAQAAVSP